VAGLLLLSFTQHDFLDSSAKALCVTSGAIAVAWLAAKYEDRATRRIMRVRGCPLLMAMAVGLAFAAFQLSINLDARWWIIEDHNILRDIGPDNKFTFGEMPSLVTRFGFLTSSSLCRPAYQIMYGLECMLWGTRPGLWYVSRIVILGFFVGSILHVVRRWTGWVAACGFTMYIFLSRYWIDMWTRLGISEVTAVIGCGLYLLGSFGIRDTCSPLSPGRKVTKFEWCLMLSGAAIAIGARENFAVLALPVCIFLAHAFLQKRTDWFGVAASVTILMYLALFVFVTAIGLARFGHVYSEDVNPTSRVAVTLGALMDPGLISIAVCLLASLSLTACVIVRYLGPRRFSRFKTAALVLLCNAVGLLALFLSQKFFYGRGWPVPIRYSFPGVLSIPVMALCTAVFTGHVLRIVGMDYRVLRHVRMGVATALVVLVVGVRGGALRYYSKLNVARTERFSGYIDQVVEEVSKEPGKPIMFVCQRPADFECVMSVSEFLEFYAVQNPIFLTYSLASDLKGEDGLVAGLQACDGFLADISSDGRGAIRPLSDYDGSQCFEVLFSDAKTTGGHALTRITLVHGTWMDIE
jgi:hypothetical protein